MYIFFVMVINDILILKYLISRGLIGVALHLFYCICCMFPYLKIISIFFYLEHTLPPRNKNNNNNNNNHHAKSGRPGIHGDTGVGTMVAMFVMTIIIQTFSA